MFYRFLLVSLLLAAAPGVAHAHGPAGQWEPWAKAKKKPAEPTVPSSNTWTFIWAVRFYQMFISPADGAGCTYYPTCSGYSIQALKKHGPVTGFFMTAERVNRNHSNQDGYFPQIKRWGKVYIYDPVSNNDFWFGDSRRTGPNLFAHPDEPTEIFWDRY